MKRTITTLFALSLLVGGAPLAYAQDTEQNARIEAEASLKVQADKRSAFDELKEKIRANTEAKREIIKENAEARKAAVKSVKTDNSTSSKTTLLGEFRVKKEADRDERKELKAGFRLDIAKKKIANTVRVFTAAVERLENLVERIQSRIDKVKAAGGNTAEAEVALSAAVTDIATAKVKISALSSLSLGSDTTASTTIEANLEAMKSAAKEVKETLKSVHENLRKAVSSLNMSVRSQKSATTTTTSTN